VAVIGSSLLARQAVANSAAKVASLTECDTNTSQAFLWFAMIAPNALCKFARIKGAENQDLPSIHTT
jgi:hypothetical protein